MMTDGGRGIFLQLAPIVGSYTSVGVGKSMWLFTSTGMLSVVAHREQKKDLLVRARNPSHILEMFPNVAIDENLSADYRFRTVISREIFARAITNYILNLRYDNFKNSINEEIFHDYCVDIWSIMYDYGLTQGKLV